MERKRSIIAYCSIIKILEKIYKNINIETKQKGIKMKQKIEILNKLFLFLLVVLNECNKTHLSSISQDPLGHKGVAENDVNHLVRSSQ